MGERKDRDHHHHSRQDSEGKERKFQNTNAQCSLLIENILEPDSYKDFESEIKSCGTSSKFWINKRSRTCVVTYCDFEDAIAAFKKFSSMLWPDKKGENMRVKLIQNSDVSEVITRIQLAQNITRPEQDKFTKESRLAQGSSSRVDEHDRRRSDRNNSYEKESRREKDHDRLREKSKVSSHRYSRERNESKGTKNDQSRISQSFYKTNFQPSVYYTIQSSDVVASRKQNIENFFKQEREDKK